MGKIKVRFIPLKGNTEVIYKGKKPKTVDQKYDFIMSSPLLQNYFPYWTWNILNSKTEEGALEEFNKFVDEDETPFKSVKEYILNDFMIEEKTFEEIIEQIDSNLRNYDNRIEVE